MPSTPCAPWVIRAAPGPQMSEHHLPEGELYLVIQVGDALSMGQSSGDKSLPHSGEPGNHLRSLHLYPSSKTNPLETHYANSSLIKLQIYRQQTWTSSSLGTHMGSFPPREKSQMCLCKDRRAAPGCCPRANQDGSVKPNSPSYPQLWLWITHSFKWLSSRQTFKSFIPNSSRRH